MSLTFKFDKKGEVPKPDDPAAAPDASVLNYAAPGVVRVVSFAWPDGNETVLNYSELRKMELSGSGELIVLTFFGGEVVSIKGSNLHALFQSFKQHLPEKVICMDERYSALRKPGEIFVTEILIEEVKGKT